MIFGQHDPNTLEQFHAVKGGTVHAALMADGHYGYIMPVGGVAAYRNAVSVNGVGFDIACGNCAIATDLMLPDLMDEELASGDILAQRNIISSSERLAEFGDLIMSRISFGVGRSNVTKDAPTDHEVFMDDRWWLVPDAHRATLREKARTQLGTVGSGNHYVDVFVDPDTDCIWVGVHFGSRGFGHTIASNYLAMGQGGAWGDTATEAEVILDLSTSIGQDYWNLMELAGDYAYAGREWVTAQVVDMLGGHVVDVVHNHHNFAWKETHFGEELVVVRKGATPAFPGQLGFVGGSMGDNAVILEGARDGTVSNQQAALYSTVHGAGRVMSRTAAAGKRNRKTGELKRNKETGEIINPGKISAEMMQGWLDETGVVLRGAGRDEAPQAYRRLPDVLAAQGDTINVLHTLKPLIVVMAAANEFDPYKE